jgi:hypothetical protein
VNRRKFYACRFVDPFGVSLCDNISQSTRLAGLHDETGFEAMGIGSLGGGVSRKGYPSAHTWRIGDVCGYKATVQAEGESVVEPCDIRSEAVDSLADWPVAKRSFIRVLPES